MALKPRKSAPERKADIVNTMMGLAFEVGPDRVTTGMIADRLGVSQPAIYKHFASKTDIWGAVAEMIAGKIAENIAKSRTGDQAPDDQLHRLVLGHLRLVEEYPALPEIMTMRDPGGSQKTLRAKMHEVMASFHAELVSSIRNAVGAGIFYEDLDYNDAAALVLGTIQSLVLRALLARETKTLVQDGQRLLTLQLSGFVNISSRFIFRAPPL